MTVETKYNLGDEVITILNDEIVSVFVSMISINIEQGSMTPRILYRLTRPQGYSEVVESKIFSSISELVEKFKKKIEKQNPLTNV